MIVHGIVVAAGTGTRYGAPKAGLSLSGRPLWEWSRDLLLAGGVASVVLVGEVPGGIPGGARRRDSVAVGLAALPADATHVVVHDAARPLATADLVRRVIARLEVGDAEGVVPAVPLRDAIKRIDDEWVGETVDRTSLSAVQTPQGFQVEALRRAHETADFDAVDDAVLIELGGGRVAVVAGEAHNIKITFPGDLELAARLLP